MYILWKLTLLTIHLACYKINKVKREQYVNEFKGPPINLYNCPNYIHNLNFLRLKYF